MGNAQPFGAILTLCFTVPKLQVAFQEGLFTFPQNNYSVS